MYPMRANSPNAVVGQTEVDHEAEGYLEPSAGQVIAVREMTAYRQLKNAT